MSTGRIDRIHVYHGFERALGEAIAAPLRAALPDREVVVWHREEDLRAGLPEVEVLVAFRPPRGVWAPARRLRFIQMMGAGVDALLPAPDLPSNVRVANARGIHGAQMSEFALAMILALAKKLPRAQEQKRERLWKFFVVEPVAGKTLGILGLGAIGQAIAAKAQALGMRVIGTQREPKPVVGVDLVLGGDAASLERVLRESDFAVLLFPLTPETRGSIGAREIAWLRPSAYLINLARGGIVDEHALADALHAGRLAGIASDVFAQEPLGAESPLWEAPNAILTPHVSGMAVDYMARLCEIAVENLRHVERDEPLRNPVDRARGY
jgi:phosphoglycerate dehydrogenase-like enzyme